MSSDAFDVDFDFRTECPPGRDPDRFSATLREQHRLMWTKELPSGPMFELRDTFPKGYLKYFGSSETFSLGSDMSIRTFARTHRMRDVVQGVSRREMDEFRRRGCTIAGVMLFPRNRIDRKHTINQARGLSRKVEDRLDLTLECIRRHYRGEDSPMSGVLARYGSFFDLFNDFAGYVTFWLLDDLVNDDETLRFFTDWTDFRTSRALPTAEEYDSYRRATLEFLEGRRGRMQQHLDVLLGTA